MIIVEGEGGPPFSYFVTEDDISKIHILYSDVKIIICNNYIDYSSDFDIDFSSEYYPSSFIHALSTRLYCRKNRGCNPVLSRFRKSCSQYKPLIDMRQKSLLVSQIELFFKQMEGLGQRKRLTLLVVMRTQFVSRKNSNYVQEQCGIVSRLLTTIIEL